MPDEEIIAVCGLDCGSCDIRLATTNNEAAERLAEWFKSMGWLKDDDGVEELLRKAPYCMGCHGDRGRHWSPDCWILKCCIDEKGLNHCSECKGFPCEELEKWSGQNGSYSEAFERLKSMSD